MLGQRRKRRGNWWRSMRWEVSNREPKTWLPSPLCLETASLLLQKKYNFWLGAWLPRGKKKLHFPVSLAGGCGHMAVSWPLGRDLQNIQATLLLGRGVPSSSPLLLDVHMVVMSPLGPFRRGQHLRDSREWDWRGLGPSIIHHKTCPRLLTSRLLQKREVTSILFKTLLFESLLRYVISVSEASLFSLPIYKLCHM